MRIFRTLEGGYVLESDPAAAFLAFADDDDVPDEVQAEVGVKSAQPAANKARRAAENKH